MSPKQQAAWDLALTEPLSKYSLPPDRIRVPVDLDVLLAVEEERQASLVLARRVHAECGPEEHGEYHKCKTCLRWAWKRERDIITHKPDCLWLAADALLRKAAQ